MTSTADPSPSGGGGQFPVFVDETGRRHRRLRILGWVIGVLAGAYLALFVVSLLAAPGAVPLSLPGIGRLVPDAGAPDIGGGGPGRRHVGEVVATSSPTPSANTRSATTRSSATPTATPTPRVVPSPRRPSPTPHLTTPPNRTPRTAGPTKTPTAKKSPTARPTRRGSGRPTAKPTHTRGGGGAGSPSTSPT